ncbi:MAG: hypothetical protein ACXWMK_09900 [Syntrophales bacterium]
MKIALKASVFVFSLLFMFGLDFVDGISPRVVFVRNAEAIVGMPFTPMSYAGVARRTTRRVVATEAAVVTTTAVAATAAAAAAPKPAAPPPSTVVVVTSPPPAAPAASGVPIGTVVQALPAGCKSVVVGGVSYSDCGGVFYKAAFQGNNLVYVVVPSPL